MLSTSSKNINSHGLSGHTRDDQQVRGPFYFGPSGNENLTITYHEDEISVLGTDRSQEESYKENMGGEEGFQIHIQSQQS